MCQGRDKLEFYLAELQRNGWIRCIEKGAGYPEGYAYCPGDVCQGL